MPEFDDFAKSIGMVIQGPVVSRGRTAATRDKPPEAVQESDVVCFDCAENIKALVDEGTRLYGRTVYVAWDTDDLSRLKSDLPDDALVVITDLTPKLPASGKAVAGNNKFRQFYAVQQGLLAIRAPNIKFAIKVRADQKPDLRALTQYLFDTRFTYTETAIYVPSFKRGMSFGIEDFYLASSYSRLLELCRLMVGFGYREFSRDVHCDLFGKASQHFLGAKLDLPLREYFVRRSYSAETYGQLQIAQLAWSELFAPFPRSIWEGCAWRGVELGPYCGNLHDPNEVAILLEMQSQQKTSLRSCLKLCYIDWARFVVFALGRRFAWVGNLMNTVADTALTFISFTTRARMALRRRIKSIFGKKANTCSDSDA